MHVSIAHPWLLNVRACARRTTDGEIYCFCSPSETMIEQDRFPYAPGWISLDDMSLIRARRIADYLGVPLSRGSYDEMVNEWHMDRSGVQIVVSNRLAEKIDTINC